MGNDRWSWQQSICVAENEKKSDGHIFFCADRRADMLCPGSFDNHSRSVFAEVIQKLWWPLLYQWWQWFGGKFKIELPFAQKQPKKYSQKHRFNFIYIHSEVSYKKRNEKNHGKLGWMQFKQSFSLFFAKGTISISGTGALPVEKMLIQKSSEI